jgi:hypothetical protein
MKKVNINVLIGSIAAVVVAICSVLNELFGIAVLIAVSLAAYIYYKHMKDKKEKAAQQTMDNDTLLGGIIRGLGQIIIDSLRGLERQFGLPNADKLSPIMTSRASGNATIFRISFKKLPNMIKLDRQTLDSLCVVLDSAIQAVLNNNIYNAPFNTPCTDNGFLPCIVIIKIYDNGQNIAIDVIVPYDAPNYDKAINIIKASQNPPPPPPPRADTPFDSDF